MGIAASCSAITNARLISTALIANSSTIDHSIRHAVNERHWSDALLRAVQFEFLQRVYMMETMHDYGLRKMSDNNRCKHCEAPHEIPSHDAKPRPSIQSDKSESCWKVAMIFSSVMGLSRLVRYKGCPYSQSPPYARAKPSFRVVLGSYIYILWERYRTKFGKGPHQNGQRIRRISELVT